MKHATAGVYRIMRQEPVVGQMRYKEWRFAIMPISERDPMWVKRCKEYWELQQETYGLKMSDFTMRINLERNTVETASRIERILPGQRVMDYKAPRLQA